MKNGTAYLLYATSDNETATSLEFASKAELRGWLAEAVIQAQ
jgi:hypothetical protein